ncbi:MAG: hypothetical protein KME30_17190 [Iphinoe sp. HA4291-MV1]|jgi:hypothetical protein|nr:hypothetical protein [Iphinoe sp. HA4291-MV1]
MNPSVINKLPQTTSFKGSYALLARLDGQSVWEFLTMPTEISYTKANNYTSANTPFSPPYLQYSGSDNWVMSINNLPLSTLWQNRNLLPYIEQFQQLAEPDTNAYSPPALAFRWNQRTFSPCLLGNITRNETMWFPTGELAEAKLSFTLTQIPDDQLIIL